MGPSPENLLPSSQPLSRLQIGEARLFGAASLRAALRSAAAAGGLWPGGGLRQAGAAAHGRGGRGPGTAARGGAENRGGTLKLGGSWV